MELQKVEKAYDTYTAKFSRAELTSIRDALASTHGDPVVDELMHAINWYFDKLPGPGQSKKEKDSEIEASETGTDQIAPGDIAIDDEGKQISAPEDKKPDAPAPVDLDKELPEPGVE